MTLSLLVLGACMGRPDVPGTRFAWERDETQDFVDGPTGAVRVHFVRDAADAVDPKDQDADGVPDLAEDVAWYAESALDYYAAIGFAPPMSEAEAGLDDAGGSAALDLYLTDLADSGFLGLNVADACVDRRCATYILLQFDALDPLGAIVAHEVFHAVQAGYEGTYDGGWIIEGAADYAALPFFTDAGDFDTSAYLKRADCGLADVQGTGRCGRAAYAASLLWWFLDEEVGPDVLLHATEARVEAGGVDALADALAEDGTSLEEVWPSFAAWNLATGPRTVGGGFPAGAGYAFSALWKGVDARAEGAAIDDRATYAPLSARYFRVDHAGGELWLATDGPAAPLVVSAHPVVDHGADGEVAFQAPDLGVPSNGRLLLGEFDAGGVWLAVSDPSVDTPVTARLCIGDERAVEACDTGGCAVARGGPWLAWVALGLVTGRRRVAG